MKLNNLVWLMVVVSLCLASLTSAQEKKPARKPLPFRQEMVSLLEGGKFDKLDELAARFRSKKMKTDELKEHFNGEKFWK